MKAGIYTSDGQKRYFVLSDRMEMLDWELFDELRSPVRLREAVSEAIKVPSNEAFCSTLRIIEDVIQESPDYLAKYVGAGRAWRSTLRLEPPVTPRTFICVGLNYRDHAIEAKMKIPTEPLLFAKTGNALSGQNFPVNIPDGSSLVDYEAELAIVIGRSCSAVTRKNALGFVAGYMCGNDISARDFQQQQSQWYRGKSADGFGPIGPWIVTPAEVGDPEKLSIRLRLNGSILQDSNTSNLIFGIADLISYISQTITLVAGDVILTGTPAGVGYTREPPIRLKSQDRLEVEIERIGTLVNHVYQL